MTFNSISYLIFLVVVLLLYYKLDSKINWIILLVASYLFYAALKAPLALMSLVAVTFVSYIFGLRMIDTTKARSRSLALWLGCGICVLILIAIKYVPAFIPPLAPTTQYAILFNSVGASYFVFQAISYLADVYLERQEPERHLGIYAVSLAFFPKIAQGPIERKGDLVPQLRNPRTIDYGYITSAIVLFSIGLFKKAVLADRLGLYANSVFDNVRSYSGISLIIGVYAYAFQIYFDFAGYTDMARGSAKLFGINLSVNFNHPYYAESVADFWRKWHMSFSRWILDYIFQPLQLAIRNFGKAGTAFALIVTFLVSGVWHGAQWGYVIWGLLHGTYLAASTLSGPLRKRIAQNTGIRNELFIRPWRMFATFNLICFAWIFFRSNSLDDAWYVISNMFIFNENLSALKRSGVVEFAKTFILFGNGFLTLLVAFLSTVSALLILFEFGNSRNESAIFQQKYPPIARGLLYASFCILLLMGANNAPSQFIYFQF